MTITERNSYSIVTNFLNIFIKTPENFSTSGEFRFLFQPTGCRLLKEMMIVLRIFLHHKLFAKTFYHWTV